MQMIQYFVKSLILQEDPQAQKGPALPFASGQAGPEAAGWTTNQSSPFSSTSPSQLSPQQTAWVLMLFTSSTNQPELCLTKYFGCVAQIKP